MKLPLDFTPKLFTIIKDGITKNQIRQDILSGIIVGIVALPLAIAFAIASGVSPQKGLITAIFAGFIISAFGGSRVQIGGPTGAFIVIVYGIVQKYGIQGLTFATLIAGVIILIMGLLKFGTLLKYIPHPLIIGFTSGIAIIIFSSQINDFFGLSIDKVPANFIEKWLVYFSNFEKANYISVIIGLGTIVISLKMSKISKKIPGSLVAILLSTIIVYLFKLPVDTIETKFGAIPNNLPKPQINGLNFEQIKMLLPAAFAIAILGGIESLLSAVVADGMTGGKHRSNMELVAQGIANIFSGIIGGIPATGAIARTATNIRNGGRTPIAGIVHAITLLVIMLLAAPFAKLIPLSCLAGILIVVAFNMGEWHNFKSVFNGNIYDRLVLLTVFFLTVIFDLIVAIEIGIVLSAFLFVKRMSDIVSIDVVENKNDTEDIIEGIPKEILIYKINGALFFGAAQSFQEALRQTHLKPKAIILNFKNVPLIDATGLYRLADITNQFKKMGILVYFTEFSPKVKSEIMKKHLGEWVIMHPSIEFCIKNAKEKLNL